MQLYDTPHGRGGRPRAGPVVTMYTCGITPYDAATSGPPPLPVAPTSPAPPPRPGHETLLRGNVTDVDDDILRRPGGSATTTSTSPPEMARFDRCMAALDLLDSWSEPRATSPSPTSGFIGMVARPGLRLPGGRGGVLRRRARSCFGRISHPPAGDAGAGRRAAAATSTTRTKRDPLDFVLWQPSAEDRPAWESLWGPGQPGWQHQCSALALRELDTTIDLTAGAPT